MKKEYDFEKMKGRKNPYAMKELIISKEPIELYKILKLESMVSTGGEAKSVIAEGLVLVNGKIETRKRKKIIAGNIIEFGKEIVRVQLK